MNEVYGAHHAGTTAEGDRADRRSQPLPGPRGPILSRATVQFYARFTDEELTRIAQDMAALRRALDRARREVRALMFDSEGVRRY